MGDIICKVAVEAPGNDLRSEHVYWKTCGPSVFTRSYHIHPSAISGEERACHVEVGDTERLPSHSNPKLSVPLPPMSRSSEMEYLWSIVRYLNEKFTHVFIFPGVSRPTTDIHSNYSGR